MKIIRRIGIYSLYLLSLTWRIETLGTIDHKPKVLAFWHGNMLPIWFYFRNFNQKVAIVSKSKDGQLLSKYLKLLNYKLIRGSSSKGGKEVIENAVLLGKENIILITPDGPRGPREVMKIGALLIAHKASIPLQLCTLETKFAIKLKSWDRFVIPLPFAKVQLNFSEIFEIEQINDSEEVQREIIQFEKILSNTN